MKFIGRINKNTLTCSSRAMKIVKVNMQGHSPRDSYSDSNTGEPQTIKQNTSMGYLDSVIAKLLPAAPTSQHKAKIPHIYC